MARESAKSSNRATALVPSPRDAIPTSSTSQKRAFFRSSRQASGRSAARVVNNENYRSQENLQPGSPCLGLDGGPPSIKTNTEKPSTNYIDNDERRVVQLTSAGNSHFSRGEYDEAMRMYDEVLRISGPPPTDSSHHSVGSTEDGIWRKNRSVTARILINIGAVHIQRDDLDAAEGVLKRALQLSLAVSKQVASIHAAMEHTDGNSTAADIRLASDAVTADVLQNMGLVHLKRHQYETGLELYGEALTMRRKCLEYLTTSNGNRNSTDNNAATGPSKDLVNGAKLELADVLNSVGLIYEKRSNHEESIPAFKEALTLRRSALATNPNHDLITSVLSSLGHAYNEVGGTKFQQRALKCHEEVLVARKEQLGPDHADVAAAMNGVAGSLLYLGRHNECLKASLQAVEISSGQATEANSSGKGKFMSLQHATALNNLGLVYTKLSRFDEAHEAFQESLELRTSLLGSSNHHSIAATIHNIGNVHCERGEYKSAILAFKNALRIKEATLGRNHSSVAVTLDGLGTCQMWQKQYDKSIKSHKKAIRIWKAALGTTVHPKIANVMNNLGVSLKRGGRLDEAMECFTDALRVYRESGVSPDNAGVVSVVRNIADFEHSRAEAAETP